MKLSELLAFATKNRATELYLAVDMPMEILVAGEVKRINLPPLQAKDFEELVVRDLGELERESLRAVPTFSERLRGLFGRKG